MIEGFIYSRERAKGEYLNEYYQENMTQELICFLAHF